MASQLTPNSAPTFPRLRGNQKGAFPDRAIAYTLAGVWAVGFIFTLAYLAQ